LAKPLISEKRLFFQQDVNSHKKYYTTTTNIGELKDNLSKFIRLVEKGEAVEVRKRNIPIARIVP
jgi:hypothetical protein